MRPFALVAALAISASVSLAGRPALAVVESTMTTPPASSATVKITMSITTSLGSSTDDDTRTMATVGTAVAAFAPDAAPFASSQANALAISFANTTFVFNLFCFPFIGCQTLNVSVSDLTFTLIQPTCAPIATNGDVVFPQALFHVSGAYSTSGVATASGILDNVGPQDINCRITSPASGAVLLDGLTFPTQTFIADPASLPSGVTALTITIEPDAVNTTLSGAFAASSDPYDADKDGQFDACDACTDIDRDGFGDPDFPANACELDNCPAAANPSQNDRDLDNVGDACDCLADVSPAKSGGNGTVNVDDLLAVISAWGNCSVPPAACAADCSPAIAPDGLVNVDDLLAIVGAWGACN